MTTCDSCGIALGAEPVHLEEKLYCCSGCTAGGPCICSYDQDLGRFPPAQYARPVSLAELLDRYERGIQKRGPGSDARTAQQKNEHLT